MTGFTGCVQYFNMGVYILPVSGHSVMMDVWPSPTLVQSSCGYPGVCLPSPCSAEDTARRDCLSARCQNRWRCGPAVQNSSCICLYNVSASVCDLCISTTKSHDRCSGAHGGLPLWLLAVILPLISIMIITGMFVAFYKVRQQNTKSQRDKSPQKTGQGADNEAFCSDDNKTLTGVAPTEKEKQHEPYEQRLSVELYCDASLSSFQPVPNSEPEYYEIGSISSAFHSDAASLQLSWHKHFYTTKCVKAEPRQWGDLKMLFAGFKRESSREEWAKRPIKPQNVASLNTQLLTKTYAEQSQQTSPCYKFLQPEFLKPVQCLSFEEISKLNTSLEQTVLHQAALMSGPAKCTAMIDVLSDSDTDSTFTGAESECGHFSVISARKYTHEQSSVSGCSFFLNHVCQSAAGHCKADKTSSTMFEHWENILYTHLPFSSYAPVFEDIACLPNEPSHNYDIQSDIEEII